MQGLLASLVKASSLKGGKLPTQIVYLPEGTHEISASIDGRPQTRTITVEQKVLAAFQSSLAARLSENVRPFIDFEHEGAEAAGLPVAFSWVEGKGLMLEVDWTSSGADAIKGRRWSYFSPEFLVSKEGTPLGLGDEGPVGGLVNLPAFTNISRIAAKQRIAQPQKQNKKAMSQTLVNIGLLSREEARNDDAETVAARRFADTKSAADQANAELVTAKARISELENEVNKTKEAQAEIVVAKHVMRGRIAPKDEASQAFWKKSWLADAKGTEAALNALPTNMVEAKAIGGVISGDNHEFGSEKNDKALELVSARQQFAKDGVGFTDAVTKSMSAEDYDAYRKRFDKS